MTVRECVVEIRKVEDVLNTLNKYDDGVMQKLSRQNIDAIREVLEHYLDAIAKMKIAT